MNAQLPEYLKIIDTPEYGKGVFARRNIKKGEVVYTLDGEIITFDKCIERIKSGDENQTDSLQVGLELDMDLDTISRTFNHSCNPSCLIRKTSEMFAIRDIVEGEEITYDYSATIGPNIPQSLWTMVCLCRSSNCRKKLGNVLTIPKDQLDIYAEIGGLQDYIVGELARVRIEDNKYILPNYRTINL